MHSLSRRTSLRALCGCAASFVLPLRAGAQALPAPPKPGLGQIPDAWSLAEGHVDRALQMSGSVARSLDGLTSRTATALEQAGKLKDKLGTLGRDLEKFTRQKADLMEEYRNGLFCSGCGKTRSQILAVGDTFPHPGQKVVRPTPEQIAAKERELQAPIDRTRSNLEHTRKDLADNEAKADAGLVQIRHGVRLWRTATSYAETAVARGTSHSHQLFTQQLPDLQRNHASAQGVLAKARTKEAMEIAQDEVQTWERLVVKHQADVDAFLATSARARRKVAQRVGDERRRINGFVTRGDLFARVGGPPAVTIPWTAIGSEMGDLYLMGKLPEGSYIALGNVQQFCRAYRDSGRDFPLAGQPAPPGPGPGPSPAPAVQEVRVPAGAGKLLQALP